MRIANRQIGPDHPPYIIAEIGVNHDGSVERALELTRAAKNAGADAVKLQLFKADLLMSRAAKLAAYQKAAGESDPIDMLRRLELSIDQMEPIVTLSHELGIHAIVTCFSVELVDEAEQLAWDAYKTASPDIIHTPLLDRLAATDKPLIVSTGASTLDEVKRAVEWLRPARDRLAIMQCVSSYPTRWEDMSLMGIEVLQENFAGAVGYSDHTSDTRTGRFAVTVGAALLEKHLTYDRSAAGPDHAASLDPAQFATYTRLAVKYWDSLRNGREYLDELERFPREGDEDAKQRARLMVTYAHSLIAARESRVKIVLPCEQDVRRVSRQSITTKTALPAGHVIRRDDLTFKRPGTGIEPFRIAEVIGRTTAREVDADMPLASDDLA